jgi:hypothetical protein
MYDWLLSVILVATLPGPTTITAIQVETVLLPNVLTCLSSALYAKKALEEKHGDGTIVIIACRPVLEI